MLLNTRMSKVIARSPLNLWCKNNVSTPMYPAKITEITNKNEPNIPESISGFVEKEKIPSQAYENKLFNVHFVSPAISSTL